MTDTTSSTVFALCCGLLLSCGRTPIANDADAGEPAVIEAPLFVFTGTNCPSRGTEQDLTPLPSDGIALVRYRAAIECSGAGGDWLIGRQEGSTRDFFVGEHSCFFHSPGLPSTGFAVVRYSQTAALFHTPTGWCLTDESGVDPASTDSHNLAWGIYATEAGARAAAARLQK